MNPLETNGDTKTARVLIVDDHPVVREGLAIRIAGQPDLQVCGEAADAPEALQCIDSLHPDVAIIDISLLNSNGIDLIQRIRERNSSVRTLVWSMHAESLYAERALRAGALGYINKVVATDKIIEAIRCVSRGNVYVSEQFADRLLHRNIGPAQPIIQSPIERLSNRELEVFRMIGECVPTNEIALRLHVSPKTVETYRSRMKAKLNLKSAAELMRLALQWVMENG